MHTRSYLSISVIDKAQVQATLRSGCILVSLNAEKLYHLRNGDFPADFLSKAVFTVDGKGGEIFARIGLGQWRLAKFNLPQFILSSPESQDLRILLIGATAVNSAAAVERLRARGFTVEGIDGYQSKTRYEETIRSFQPDIVFIGMGSPLQERIALELHESNPALGVVCCGGAINVMAGHVDKCPEWIDRLYLEWLYRLAMQPSRLRRIPRLLQLPGTTFATLVARLLRPG